MARGTGDYAPVIGGDAPDDDVVYAQLSTDANGNTTISSGGVEYPLQRYSVTTLKLSADTVALATSTAIPFDVVAADDIGLTAASFALQPSRVYFPATTKRIRVSYRVMYGYVGATPSGTFRGAGVGVFLNGVTATATGVVGATVAPALNSPAANQTEGGVTASSGILDIVSYLSEVEALPLANDNNWVQITTQHNSTTPTTLVVKGAAPLYSAYLTVECWE